MKEAEHKPAERWPVFMDVFFIKIVQMTTLSKEMYIFNANHTQIPMEFLTELEKNNSKIYMGPLIYK